MDVFQEKFPVSHLVADADRALGGENSLKVKMLAQCTLFNLGSVVSHCLLVIPLLDTCGIFSFFEVLSLKLVGLVVVLVLNLIDDLHLEALLKLLKHVQVIDLVGKLCNSGTSLWVGIGHAFFSNCLCCPQFDRFTFRSSGAKTELLVGLYVLDDYFGRNSLTKLL